MAVSNGNEPGRPRFSRIVSGRAGHDAIPRLYAPSKASSAQAGQREDAEHCRLVDIEPAATISADL